MPFHPGKYTLRASPAVGLGGMFATGHDIGKVVTVAAQVPSTWDFQTWDIKAVEGKNGIYTITHCSKTGFEEPRSWSLKESPPEAPPSGPVILFQKAHEWYIYPSDEVPDAIRIQPVRTDHTVGADFYVGTHENQVVIIGIPVVPGQQDKIPYWKGALQRD